jgi:cellulose synthase/poly-beta-1,6-N-acetylglucosamine synthase-like glycosyltransferase
VRSPARWLLGHFLSLLVYTCFFLTTAGLVFFLFFPMFMGLGRGMVLPSGYGIMRTNRCLHTLEFGLLCFLLGTDGTQDSELGRAARINCS